jgi:ABC-type transport system involved in multi-copper enzyme maturation permease subunit
VSIWVIAKTTLGEALRKKILNIFLMVALAMIVFSVSFAYFSYREELTIIKSMGLGVIALAGMFIAIVQGINLVPAEIERRTIYTILSKPVRRHEFLLGKYFGSLLTIFVNVALMSLVFLVMVAWKNHWVPDFALIKGIVMIYFQLIILSAVALIFSVFTTPVINFFMTTAVYIVGSLSEVTMALAQNDKQNMFARGFYWVLHYAVPQFANFFVQNPLIHPEVAIRNEGIYYATNIIYALVYASVLMIIAILAFERRDM